MKTATAWTKELGACDGGCSDQCHSVVFEREIKAIQLNAIESCIGLCREVMESPGIGIGVGAQECAKLIKKLKSLCQ